MQINNTKNNIEQEKLNIMTPKINISDKNLTNTEAQTIQKTLNDEEINFEDEENINDEVSEETIAKLTEIADTAPKLELVVKESFYLQKKFNN